VVTSSSTCSGPPLWNEKMHFGIYRKLLMDPTQCLTSAVSTLLTPTINFRHTHTRTHTHFNIIFSSVMSCVGLAVTYCFFFLQLICYRYCCLASAAGYAYFKFITGYYLLLWCRDRIPVRCDFPRLGLNQPLVKGVPVPFP
jgi:hypothetical protein